MTMQVDEISGMHHCILSVYLAVSQCPRELVVRG